MTHADEVELLKRIVTNPAIFGGKPVIRGHRLAVEHVLGMLAAGDSPETILKRYDWLEPEDIRACLLYARRLAGHERVEPALPSESVRPSPTRVRPTAGSSSWAEDRRRDGPCLRRPSDRRRRPTRWIRPSTSTSFATPWRLETAGNESWPAAPPHGQRGKPARE
jgi:uncharacterized protein (DUF433 family)